MIKGETAYELQVYTIKCEKCTHVYYIPAFNSYPYKFCPYCKNKLKLDWIND